MNKLLRVLGGIVLATIVFFVAYGIVFVAAHAASLGWHSVAGMLCPPAPTPTQIAASTPVQVQVPAPANVTVNCNQAPCVATRRRVKQVVTVPVARPALPAPVAAPTETGKVVTPVASPDSMYIQATGKPAIIIAEKLVSENQAPTGRLPAMMSQSFTPGPVPPRAPMPGTAPADVGRPSILGEAPPTTTIPVPTPPRPEAPCGGQPCIGR